MQTTEIQLVAPAMPGLPRSRSRVSPFRWPGLEAAGFVQRALFRLNSSYCFPEFLKSVLAASLWEQTMSLVLAGPHEQYLRGFYMVTVSKEPPFSS